MLDEDTEDIEQFRTTNAYVSLTALFIIAIGMGGVKSNLSVLGADQFKRGHHKTAARLDTFFMIFYWITNLATEATYKSVNPISLSMGNKWSLFSHIELKLTPLLEESRIQTTGAILCIKLPNFLRNNSYKYEGLRSRFRKIK